ncbi:MAG: hypothetical protein NXI31_22705 [bacterium]|nr:hypothetical protein [bacterium]
MRSAPALLAVAVAAAMLGGAVYWLGQSDEPPPPSVERPRSVDQAAAGGRPEVATAEATAEGDEGRDTAASDPEGLDLANLREEAPADDVTAAASPKVLVLRPAADGARAAPVPVAAAEVFYLTTREAEERFGERLPRRRVEWPEFGGSRTETGADGLAVLPPTRHSWLVAARTDGWFAFGVARPGKRTTKLELRRDERVTIAVFDEADRPVAGAPVAIVQHLTKTKRATSTIWTGSTGADGRAAAPHFQLARRRLGKGQKERFAAVLRVATAAPILTEFVGRPAPAAPVELRAPPTGAVEILLTDHGNRPLLSPARVVLTPVSTKKRQPDALGAAYLTHRRVEKPVGEGPVMVSWLAAGMTVRPVVRFPSEKRASIGEPIAVPAASRASSPGSNVAPLPVRMPLAPQFGLLAGRLVFADGTPVAERELTALLWDGDRRAGSIRLHTTATGHFDAVQRPRKQATLTLELRTRIPATEELPAQEVGARFDFQPPGAKVRRELGEIVLGELPLLCSGIVVDDRGEPVANADVRAQRQSSPRPKPSRGRVRGPNPALAAELGSLNLQFQSRTRSRWDNVPFLRTRTDATGAFELRGHFPGGELQVRADTKRHLADTAPWQGVGQTFRITIARNGVLRGRVLLPPGLPAECATLTLRPRDEATAKKGTRRVELSRRRGGRFEVEPLHAGRYDAIIKLRSIAQPVLEIGDVFITPGECRDPRLRVIDLRQCIHRYRLRAVDFGGRPLRLNSALMLRWRDQDGKVQNSAMRWRGGRADFFAGSTLVDLVSFAPGCRPLEVQIAPGEQTIAMERLVPAQLLVSGARQLCGPDRKIRVSVILVGDSGYPQWLSGQDQRTGSPFSFPRWELGKSTGAWLENSDLVDVPIVKNGKYEVILRVHATKSTKSRQVSVTLGQFDLRVDGSKLTPVNVPLDTAKVQKALERLQPRQKRPPR